MHELLKIAAAGSGLGFLGAVGIYFEPSEPYPGFITAAGTLNGTMIALLISTVVTRTSSLFQCLGWGALFGLLDSATVFHAGSRGCCRHARALARRGQPPTRLARRQTPRTPRLP